MRLKAKMKEKRLEPSQQKTLWLDFDRTTQSNLFTTKQK